MANGIDIVIGAEVSGALQGLQKVEAATVKAGATINKLPAAINNTTQALKKLTPGSNEAGQSLINLSRVAQDAPYGFIGIANNINPLLESFQRLKTSTGTTGGALKALGKELTGGAGLGLAIGVASSLLVVFGDKLFGASKAAKEAKSASDALKDSISGIFAESAKEAANAAGFVAILKSETETRERKLSAIKELQKIQPEIFANLKLEGNAVIGLDNAYKSYLENLKTVIAVKIKQAQLEQKIAELLQKQGVTLTASEKKIKDMTEAFKKSDLERAKRAGGGEAQSYVEYLLGSEQKNKDALKTIENDINALIGDITQLSKGVKTGEIKIKPDKIKFDFEGQFAQPITLAKPIPIQGRIFDFNTAQLGTDLLKKLEYEFGDRLKSMEKLVVTPKISLSLKALNDQKALKEAANLAESFNKQFENILTSGISSSFESLGDTIGEALTGNDFGKSILNVFSGVLSALGSALIQFGVIKSGLDKILGPAGIAISGTVAIGLGILAKAAGSAIKNFGGARAMGGPVSAGRSYLVGEREPELFVPSQNGRILNGNQIAAMSYSGGGSSGGGRQIVRGQNIILAYARTNRAQNRLGRG